MTLRLKLFYYFNIVGLFAVRAQEIASLQLINTMTNAPVLTLIDGGVVDLQALKLSSNALNIAAIPLTAGTIGSVRFGFDSISSFRVENSAPFAFCGDDNAKFKACPELLQNVGRSVRVSATPFSGTKQSGSAGSTKQVTFTIVEGGTVPVATPVSGPVPTFIATPVATPISTPVKVPVRSPVVAPVVAPGAPPVAPPVIIPAATPVQSPSVIAPEHVPECPPLNYPQNIGTGSSTDLQAAMNALAAHISGTTVLSQESLAQQRTLFQNNAIRLPTNLSLMQSALSLVDAYESRIGPLFVSGPSVGGFERNTPASPDGKELERAMITVQQGILDHIFQGSQWVNEDVIPNPLPSLVDACAAPLLRSRKWLTAKYFPGMIDPPVDESVVHTVMVNATKTPYWGKVVSFATIENIKPLDGLYLAPGAIATVTVPDTMVNAGFLLQVGANTIDNKSKSVHRRMDRITTTFVVDKMQVTVANPLGGGLYLRIPYLANLGLVSLSIKGGVVASPRVQQTRLHTTTMAEWESMKVSAPGPWVNIETDNFLATVPRNWIVSRDFSFVNQLVTDYKKAMDGVSALFGYSPDYRNNYVVHVGIDLYIKFGSYGIGYPQGTRVGFTLHDSDRKVMEPVLLDSASSVSQ